MAAGILDLVTSEFTVAALQVPELPVTPVISGTVNIHVKVTATEVELMPAEVDTSSVTVVVVEVTFLSKWCKNVW